MAHLSKKSLAANSNENAAMANKKVVGDEFVQTDFNEIQIDSISSSALQTALKRAQNFQKEKLAAQNDNNPNNGGDDTPPPADTLILPVPENSGEGETNAVAIINNGLPAIPTNSADLHNFITVGKKAVEAACTMIKRSKVAEQSYKVLHNNTKMMAEMLLDAALRLASEVNAIDSKQGHHHLSGTGTSRSKEQILEQDFHMTPKQAWRIGKLTDEAVRKEKEYANQKETVPTIPHAIKYVEAKEQQLKLAKKKQSAFEAMQRVEKKVLPDGKHDVVLSDFKEIPEKFDISEASASNAIIFTICEKSDLASTINRMEAQGFNYADCAIIVKAKMMKGSSKCFQNYHKFLIVGIKGKYDSPFAFKGSSVLYETDMTGCSEIDYIISIIEQMYPDGAYLDLISDTAPNSKWDICEQKTEAEND